MLSGVSGYYVIYILCTALLFILFRKHIQGDRPTAVVFLLAVCFGLSLPFLLLILGMAITAALGVAFFLGLFFYRYASEKACAQEDITQNEAGQEMSGKSGETVLSHEVAAAEEEFSGQKIAMEEGAPMQDVVVEGSTQEAIDKLLAELSLQYVQAEEPPKTVEEGDWEFMDNKKVEQEESILTIDADYLLEGEKDTVQQDNMKNPIVSESETIEEQEEEIIYPKEEINDDGLRFEDEKELINLSAVQGLNESDEEYFYRLQQVLDEEIKQ
ncbi:hypothetical protein [Aneurinibacillus danicus]|uniref:Uncharacterized protein n=1 Tax=Aneurinibacillus danicus TaxID=267746 RepID=A0A511V2A9_9BACL|nr:hypothetical protein [Aneurinibacillus danicus]GEN33024.1 hypothetical protein ADA01nite_04840 [Aneurinibacillus danicus]